MWKDKRFLIGLGTGLIVGSILLQLMNIAETDNQTLLFPDQEEETKQEITMEQWTAAADRLGYEYYPRTEKRYTQEEVDALIEEAVNTAKDSFALQPEEGMEVSNSEYEVMITEGMPSNAVAEALLEAGLIDDLNAFKQQLRSGKLERKILSGRFTFPQKPSMEEIIETITIN